jgi:hypothetical protein
MRAGVRKQILDNVITLKDCYEPNVPRKSTEKPYAVVVQGADTSRQDPTSFQRTLEVWLYCDIGTFQALDSLMMETIDALDLKTFTDPNTGLSYTAKFNSTIGQDMVDEEWGAIVRGLSFSVIALHKTHATNDAWENATADFIESTVGAVAYRGSWREDFQVPSVLCRTISKATEAFNYNSFRENREIRIHVVSDNQSEVNQIIDAIEHELMKSIKIPLDIDNRMYLTIKSIREDRNNDMLGAGQVTVSMTRINSIQRDEVYIEKIYSRGQVSEEV